MTIQKKQLVSSEKQKTAYRRLHMWRLSVARIVRTVNAMEEQGKLFAALRANRTADCGSALTGKGELTMPDREKVIKGLNNIGREIVNTIGHGEAVQYLRTIDDTIELLKEQEWHLLTEDDDGIIHGLPGDDGAYLMTDGKDIWIDEYTDGVDDGVWLDSGRDIREIKAWMNMPNLPKEGR